MVVEWLLCEGSMVPGLGRGGRRQAGLLTQLGVPRRGAVAVGSGEEGLVRGVVVDVLRLQRDLATWHVIRSHGGPLWESASAGL